MNTIPSITLIQNRDVPVRAGHPWIFSQAISRSCPAGPGTCVRVVSHNGEGLGVGFWNPGATIRVRMLSRDPNAVISPAYLAERISRLNREKQSLIPPATTGYRVVHGDADYLPGLIIDRYQDVVVFQLHSAGMDALRSEIIAALQSVFSPQVIVERSDVGSRRLEGLDPLPAITHYGTCSYGAEFQERGALLSADVLQGQKTGFFLDQRDTRALVETWAPGRRVLNLFCYTASASVFAARARAASIVSVDTSARALEVGRRHFMANGFDPEDPAFSLVNQDVLEFLKQAQSSGRRYDLVVCDPPAFAKSGSHVKAALTAYLNLNRACFSVLEKGGVLITSSCSGRVSPEDFLNCVRLAAGRAEVDARIHQFLGQPADHTDRLSFPEGRYLKTAVLELRALT